MDMNTLRAALREGVGYLPQEYKDKAGKFIIDVMDVMEKASDVLDETVMDLADARPTTSIYDDVRKSPEDKTFDEMLREFNAAEQGGGSENDFLLTIVDSIYMYMTDYTDSYTEWNTTNLAHNREHPIPLVIDFLCHLSNSRLQEN